MNGYRNIPRPQMGQNWQNRVPLGWPQQRTPVQGAQPNMTNNANMMQLLQALGLGRTPVGAVPSMPATGVPGIANPRGIGAVPQGLTPTALQNIINQARGGMTAATPRAATPVPGLQNQLASRWNRPRRGAQQGQTSPPGQGLRALLGGLFNR